MADWTPRTQDRENHDGSQGTGYERSIAVMTALEKRTDDSGRELAGLLRAIEGEIIPRLMLAHRAATDSVSERYSTPPAPNAEEVSEMARVARLHDVSVALALVEAVRARGTPLESIFLDLLAPAARHLGALWVEDRCDFTEVTTGLWRLQQVLHELSHEFHADTNPPQRSLCVLLAPTPGEHHTFGLLMVSEFFQRGGWDVHDEVTANVDQLGELVASRWFDAVGLSLSCENHRDSLSSAIRAVRRHSLNPSVRVLVGGPAFSDRPELVALVGADAMAVDGRRAVAQARELLTSNRKQ